MADTGIGSLVTYSLNRNGTVTQIDAVPSTQLPTCWVAPARRVLLHLQRWQRDGHRLPGKRHRRLTLLGQTATDPGTVDASASVNGQFLYVQTGGNGIVDEFQVAPTELSLRSDLSPCPAQPVAKASSPSNRADVQRRRPS